MKSEYRRVLQEASSELLVADAFCLLHVEPLHQALDLALTRVEAMVSEEVSQLARPDEIIAVCINQHECAVQVHVLPLGQLCPQGFDLVLALKHDSEQVLEVGPCVVAEEFLKISAFANVVIGATRDHVSELLCVG